MTKTPLPTDTPDDALLGAIQRLVADQDARPAAVARAPEASAPQAPAPQPVLQPVEPVTASPPPLVEEVLPPAAEASRTRRILALVARLVWQFLRRPDAPRLIALGVIGLVFLMAPGFIIFLVVFTLLSAVLGYFTLGPDRVEEMVVEWYEALSARDPDKAETIRARAARTSRFASAVAARLPARWTAGLYLPNFEPATTTPKELGPDPFDRLAQEARREGPR